MEAKGSFQITHLLRGLDFRRLRRLALGVNTTALSSALASASGRWFKSNPNS